MVVLFWYGSFVLVPYPPYCDLHWFVRQVGCADSRVAPDLIFDADAGEMFVTRVAGNVCTDEIIV